MKTYESVQLLKRAMTLAYNGHLGNADYQQLEYEKKIKIPSEEIIKQANKILVEENSSVVYYKAKNGNN